MKKIIVGQKCPYKYGKNKTDTGSFACCKCENKINQIGPVVYCNGGKK